MTQDHPDIAQLLDNMYLTETQFGEIAGLISNDEEDTPYIDLAREWMADNEDVWSEWIPEDSQ
jgi:ABC-type proline/glycine betaine transport system substrate-binding protein